MGKKLNGIKEKVWEDVLGLPKVDCTGWTNSILRKKDRMLWTIAAVLVILWLLGLVSGYTMGNFIHILLVVAIVIVLVRVIQGRKILYRFESWPEKVKYL